MNELWAFYIIEGLVMEVIGTWLIAKPFLNFSKFHFFSSSEIVDINRSLENYKTATDEIHQLQSYSNELDSNKILAHFKELQALMTHQNNIINVEHISAKRFDKILINYVTRGIIFIIGGFVLQISGIMIQAIM